MKHSQSYGTHQRGSEYPSLDFGYRVDHPRHPSYFYHIGDNTRASARLRTGFFISPFGLPMEADEKQVGPVDAGGCRYLITNPFCFGLVRHGDDLYPGQHEPLVSHELWEAVQPIRARRGEGKGGGRRADRVYLLARLARCSKCGLRLTAQTSEGKGRKGHETQYYLCPAQRRSVDCPVGGGFAPAA